MTKNNRFFFTLLWLGLIFVSTTSYNTPVLKFKVMVIDRTKLNSIFGIADDIIFQHINMKGDEEAGKRHRYHLIAYYMSPAGYVKVPNSFFVSNAFSPVPIDISGDGATSNFGNMTLNKNDLPPATSNFKYIILYPEVFNEDPDGTLGDPDYVRYTMYYAENKNDPKPLKSGVHTKSVQPIPKPLNPSPPR